MSLPDEWSLPNERPYCASSGQLEPGAPPWGRGEGGWQSPRAEAQWASILRRGWLLLTQLSLSPVRGDLREPGCMSTPTPILSALCVLQQLVAAWCWSPVTPAGSFPRLSSWPEAQKLHPGRPWTRSLPKPPVRSSFPSHAKV